MKRILNNKAFTFPEVMVTVFIFLLISGALYSSVMLGQRSWMANKVKTEHQQEIRKASERIKIDLSKSGSSKINGVPVGGTAYDSITFNVAEGATATGNVDWSSETITYALGGSDSNQLLRIVSSGLSTDSSVIAQNISSISFRRNERSLVEVSITAQLPDDPTDPDDQDRPIEQIQSSIDFKVKLRN